MNTLTTATAAISRAGGGVIQKINLNDGSKAAGLAGIRHITNEIAVYCLIGAFAAMLLGGLFATLGPRMGFHSARQIGFGGIVGGVGLAALVGVAAGVINGVYAAFS